MHLPASLHRPPLLGLLGLTVGFLTQPLGHTVYMLIYQGLTPYAFPVAFTTGVAGFVIVFRALNRDELSATWQGMLGGWLIWIGWFEFSFKFFAGLYAVSPYAVEPGVANGYQASPQANMLQATVTIMLALFIVYGLFNLQTKCNLMRWIHRNLRIDPGSPTPDNKRSFARIAAMEVLFVTWFCYLFWLYAIYFGTRAPGVYVILGLYAAWTAWALFLVWRCTKQVRAAPALRYGIGAGIVLWGTAEMPAHFGAYREYWLHPFEYPIFNLIAFAIFVAGLIAIARRPKPGARPADSRESIASV